jgi:hypothetical protein
MVKSCSFDKAEEEDGEIARTLHLDSVNLPANFEINE